MGKKAFLKIISTAVAVLFGLTAMTACRDDPAKSRAAAAPVSSSSSVSAEEFFAKQQEYASRFAKENTALQMADGSTGWLSKPDGIYRTIDGGKTWQNVSKSFWLSGTLSFKAAFDGADHAAVVFCSGCTEGPFVHITCYTTADGGRSWSSTVITEENTGEATSLLHLQLFGGSQGILIAASGAAAGSIYCDVYHTSDGGAHWQKANNSGVQLPSGRLRFSFSDLQHGTLLDTGSAYGNTAQFTSDGGITWSRPTVVFEARYGFDDLQPILMSKSSKIALLSCQNGVNPLTASGSSGHGALSIYNEFFKLTPEGSQGDKIADIVADYPIYASLTSFPSDETGYFIATVNGRPGLYELNGAKKRFLLLSQQNWMGNALQIQFLKSSTGYVLCSGLIYSTADGGKSWRKYPVPA